MKYFKHAVLFPSIILLAACLAACTGKATTAPTLNGAPIVTESTAPNGASYVALDDHGDGGEADDEEDGQSGLKARLSANPTRIDLGRSSRLQWSTSHAKSVTLNGSSVSSDGEQRVSPSSTTEYVLIARDGSHSVTSRITVRVVNGSPVPSMPSANLTASLKTITSGQSSTLNWTTSNATSATLNGSAVSTTGSQSVTPASTTTYTLNATNAAGSSSSSVVVTVTPVVPPPPVVPTATLSASSASIQSGQAVTLTWATTNATSATMNGSAVAVNGSQSYSPTATTTYTLAATGAGGSTSRSVSVTVTAPPPPPPTFTYTGNVKAALDQSCINCHNASFKSAGYDFSTYAALQPAVASHTASAILVSATQPGGKMNPYVGPSGNLSVAQVIDMFKVWVLSGAPQ